MNSHKLICSPNSGETYYFRSYIPKDLIEYFDGVRQFRVSLKCAIKSRSLRITKILDVKVSSLFEEIRIGMKSLDIEQIKEILRIEIRKQILHSHRVREGTDRWDDDGIKRSLDSIQKKELSLKDRLKSDSKSYKEEVESKLEGILKSLDIHVEKNSLEFQKLRNNFIDLYLLRHDWMRELVHQTGKSDDDFRENAQEKIGMNLFPELQESSIEDFRKSAQQNVSKTKSENLSSDSVGGQTFSECAELFYDRKSLEDTSPKEIQVLRQNINDFIEVMGDVNVSNLTKGEVSEFITIQSKLPSNRKKSPKYRDLTIAELLKNKVIDTQSPQNINKRLTKLSVFGNWCVRQGYLPESPFKDMKLSVKKSNTERKPFTAKELRKILASETYLKWTVDFKHRNNPSHKEDRNTKLPIQPSGAKNQMSYYWIFLLGILSGMRTNEMCQLRLSDLRKEKGIWFIHVEEDEDKRINTPNSIWKVPIHPQLMDLGFMQYVGNL